MGSDLLFPRFADIKWVCCRFFCDSAPCWLMMTLDGCLTLPVYTHGSSWCCNDNSVHSHLLINDVINSYQFTSRSVFPLKRDWCSSYSSYFEKWQCRPVCPRVLLERFWQNKAKSWTYSCFWHKINNPDPSSECMQDRPHTVVSFTASTPLHPPWSSLPPHYTRNLCACLCVQSSHRVRLLVSSLFPLLIYCFLLAA